MSKAIIHLVRQLKVSVIETCLLSEAAFIKASVVITVSVVTWHSITASSDLIVVPGYSLLSHFHHPTCSSAHAVREMLPNAVQQQDE